MGEELGIRFSNSWPHHAMHVCLILPGLRMFSGLCVCDSRSATFCTISSYTLHGLDRLKRTSFGLQRKSSLPRTYDLCSCTIGSGIEEHTLSDTWCEYRRCDGNVGGTSVHILYFRRADRAIPGKATAALSSCIALFQHTFNTTAARNHGELQGCQGKL